MPRPWSSKLHVALSTCSPSSYLARAEASACPSPAPLLSAAAIPSPLPDPLLSPSLNPPVFLNSLTDSDGRRLTPAPPPLWSTSSPSEDGNGTALLPSSSPLPSPAPRNITTPSTSSSSSLSVSVVSVVAAVFRAPPPTLHPGVSLSLTPSLFPYVPARVCAPRLPRWCPVPPSSAAVRRPLSLSVNERGILQLARAPPPHGRVPLVIDRLGPVSATRAPSAPRGAGPTRQRRGIPAFSALWRSLRLSRCIPRGLWCVFRCAAGLAFPAYVRGEPTGRSICAASCASTHRFPHVYLTRRVSTKVLW